MLKVLEEEEVNKQCSDSGEFLRCGLLKRTNIVIQYREIANCEGDIDLLLNY